MRVPHKVKAGLIAGLVAVLVGAPAGVGWAAYQQDASLRGMLPAGTTVAGVDVSKLTRPAALAKVRAAVERDFDRPTTVTVDGHAFTTTQRALGARDDVDRAVAKAFTKASSGNWVTRAWHRVVNGSSAPRVEVNVVDYDPAKLAALVDRAARDTAVAPVDAKVDQAGGWLTFVKARTGRSLDKKAAAEAFRSALADGMPRVLDTDPVAPKITAVGTAILVRTGENSLYLYQHGKVTKTYKVATGSARYPTPTGHFAVVLKRYLPTWVNPWSPWSMHEPAKIGPGPNNPLGTRAMNLSAPGIRIHGTPSDRSIGYSVSHGCIRMHIPEVEELYEVVPTGTPVFIVRAAPVKVAAPPAAPTGTAGAADGG